MLDRIAQLTEQCVEVVHEQRQPHIRLIWRIESEGYAVGTNTFTTVTDPRDWSLLDTIEDAAVRTQLEAEKIARSEQAAVYSSVWNAWTPRSKGSKTSTPNKSATLLRRHWGRR